MKNKKRNVLSGEILSENTSQKPVNKFYYHSFQSGFESLSYRKKHYLKTFHHSYKVQSRRTPCKVLLVASLEFRSSKVRGP